MPFRYTAMVSRRSGTWEVRLVAMFYILCRVAAWHMGDVADHEYFCALDRGYFDERFGLLT